MHANITSYRLHMNREYKMQTRTIYSQEMQLQFSTSKLDKANYYSLNTLFMQLKGHHTIKAKNFLLSLTKIKSENCRLGFHLDILYVEAFMALFIYFCLFLSLEPFLASLVFILHQFMRVLLNHIWIFFLLTLKHQVKRKVKLFFLNYFESNIYLSSSIPCNVHVNLTDIIQYMAAKKSNMQKRSF